MLNLWTWLWLLLDLITISSSCLLFIYHKPASDGLWECCLRLQQLLKQMSNVQQYKHAMTWQTYRCERLFACHQILSASFPSRSYKDEFKQRGKWPSYCISPTHRPVLKLHSRRTVGQTCINETCRWVCMDVRGRERQRSRAHILASGIKIKQTRPSDIYMVWITGHTLSSLLRWRTGSFQAYVYVMHINYSHHVMKHLFMSSHNVLSASDPVNQNTDFFAVKMRKSRSVWKSVQDLESVEGTLTSICIL